MLNLKAKRKEKTSYSVRDNHFPLLNITLFKIVKSFEKKLTKHNA